jgi:spore maturation protein CgeB
MINILFFSSKTFLKTELINAFKRRNDINLIIFEVPVLPSQNEVIEIFDKIKQFLPAIVFSLNDAGYDHAGKLGELIAKSGSYQINWYYDDPLYEHIFYKRVFPDFSKRIDFVSEFSFVNILKAKGFNAFFLPLATDLEFFNINGNKPVYKYDISFVGSSSLSFLDDITPPNIQNEVDKFIPLLKRLKEIYYNNPQENIKEWLYNHKIEWQDKISIDPDVFVFVMQWLVGYFYRKDFIVSLASHFGKKFMCFGDIYWTKFIDPTQVSTDACYYTNLCWYYRSTKVNININRIQTQTSFTQRIFDCKASGAFLLTDKRLLNSKYFITEGPNQEIVEYYSLNHCIELINYYLVHEEEREQISMAGRDKVLNFHTYDNRVEEILETAKRIWKL